MNNVHGEVEGNLMASGQSGLVELRNAARLLAENKEEIPETPGAVHLGVVSILYLSALTCTLHVPCKHFWFKRRKHNEIEAEL